MAYKLLGMAVWQVLKLVLRRQVRKTDTGGRVKLAAGLAFVAAVFLFVLSRKEGDEGG
jgi:hypothetical protein